MYTTNFLLVLLCAFHQTVWARYIAMSVNMSMVLKDEQRPTVTAAVLRSCMIETQLSLAELQRFRLSLLTHDPELLKNAANSNENLRNGNTGNGDGAGAGAADDDSEGNEDAEAVDNADGYGEGAGEVNGIVDGNEEQRNVDTDQYSLTEYDDISQFMPNKKHDEALNCFVHCLYNKLGLVANGVFMEEDLFAKLYAVVGRERHLVKECMNLNSNNKCESSYKMHLCYAKLKSLEAEQKIRNILENFDQGGGGDGAAVTDGNSEKPRAADDVKENEI